MPCSKGMRRCRRDCLHRRLVSEYHDARDARDALRESATTAPTDVPGTNGTTVTMAQLEPEDFARVFPPVLFKDWLIAHRNPE